MQAVRDGCVQFSFAELYHNPLPNCNAWLQVFWHTVCEYIADGQRQYDIYKCLVRRQFLRIWHFFQ